MNTLRQFLYPVLCVAIGVCLAWLACRHHYEGRLAERDRRIGVVEAEYRKAAARLNASNIIWGPEP